MKQRLEHIDKIGIIGVYKRHNREEWLKVYVLIGILIMVIGIVFVWGI